MFECETPHWFCSWNNEKDTIAFTWTVICLFWIFSKKKRYCKRNNFNGNSSRFPAKLKKIFCWFSSWIGLQRSRYHHLQYCTNIKLSLFSHYQILINTTNTGKDGLILYQVNISGSGMALVTSIKYQIENCTIEIRYRRGGRPTLERYDDIMIFQPNSTASYKVFRLWSNMAINYVALKVISNSTYIPQDAFEMEMFTTGCIYWNNIKEVWEGSGCKVCWLRLICSFTKLTG